MAIFSADVRWFLSCIFLFSFAFVPLKADLYDLSGKPDFRDVTLEWKFDQEAPKGFRIDYCELQPWGRKMCRRKVMDIDSSGKQWTQPANYYTYKVDDLRMATNYSFQVGPLPIQNLQTAPTGRARSPLFSKFVHGGKSGHEIVLATKQFSALGSRCLAESSEIDIETGPYFGGLITVEHPNSWSSGFKEGDCAVRGDPNDPKTVYTLSIDHSKCGSQTSNSAVTTFVIVQENLPILTHSTKRFMVVCNYSMPDSFTVKAAVQMPPQLRPAGKGQAEIIPVSDAELARAHSVLEPVISEIRTVDLVPEDANLIDSRLSVFKDNAKWVSPLHQPPDGVEDDAAPKYAQLVLMLILIIASVIGCSAAVWWFIKGARIQQTTVAYTNYSQSSEVPAISSSIGHSFRSSTVFLTTDRDDFPSIGSISSVTSGSVGGSSSRDDESALRFSTAATPPPQDDEPTESIYSGKAESEA